MKKIAALSFLMACSLFAISQGMKPYTVGFPFSISLPDYMTRTAGMNSNSAFEYKNTVKDVYGFVVMDDKETLKLAELNFSSIDEFFEEFIKEFVEGEEKVKQTKAVSRQVGNVKYLESDVSFYVKDAETEIYYLVGVVETSKSYYKVISWCTLENKAKFREDFRKILFSVKD